MVGSYRIDDIQVNRQCFSNLKTILDHLVDVRWGVTAIQLVVLWDDGAFNIVL
jgi:hypothetical protein